MHWALSKIPLRQTLLVTLLAVASLPGDCGMAKEAVPSSEGWMTRAVQFLASDELEGRGLKTEGLRRAAEFIRDEFRSAGLDFFPATDDGYQKFPCAVSSRLGADNHLEFLVAEGDADQPRAIRLTLGKNFTPLAMSGNGEIDLPLVFVGYGMSAPDLQYDDYGEVDVTGKAVIVLRHVPDRANPHSKFDSSKNSRYASLSTKVSTAYQHGAAAVVFCTDRFEINKRIANAKRRWHTAVEQLEEARAREPSPEKTKAVAKAEKQAARWKKEAEETNDELLKFSIGESSAPREIAVVHCQRDVIDKLLRAAEKPALAKLEETIDKQLEPQSFELSGCRIRGMVSIEREMVDLANVIGTIPGEGPLADETVVVGAHYDHLGRGETGSAEPGSQQIHNGADDNASGVVVLIDVARQLVKRDTAPRRRLVFVAFSGEERGLLGSAYFLRNCPVPVESIVAMVNFDMVGRLKDNKLITSGFDTAAQFDRWLDEVNQQHHFELSKQSGGFGPSDHATFYAKKIPVIHFFTGAHSDYHRPTDDFHLLDVRGMQRVSRFAVDWITKLASTEEAIEYKQVAPSSQRASRRDPRPYFGSIPDFGRSGVVGYAISGVAPGSPADEAGLQGGDAIVALGPDRIGNLEDFDNALRKYEAGDRVPIVFTRGEKRIESEVILDPPR